MGIREREAKSIAMSVVSSAAQLHGWNQPAGLNVNIANIPLPTEKEVAERRARHKRLDSITARLLAKDQATPGA